MGAAFRGASLVAFAVLTACRFDVEYGAGYRCIDDGDCPADQRCIDNTCQVAAGEVLDAGAAGDGGPLPPNLLLDPGFELGIEAAWSDYHATLTETSDAPHGGEAAVRVCASEPGVYTLNQRLGNDPAAGDTFVASVWLRASDQPVTVKMAIREANEGGVWTDHEGDEVVVGDDWQELTYQATVEEAGRAYALLIFWGLDELTCFDADDAYAYLVGS